MISKVVLSTLIGCAFGINLRNSTQQGGWTVQKQIPCQCQANDPSWKTTSRTVPKCIFIDLGAADGNSFQAFLNGAYGPVGNCPSGGQWEAYLVEANPNFSPTLMNIAAAMPGAVHNYAATAAYMCQGQTSFTIDADPTHNHWASSMKDARVGSQSVTVPTVNVIQLLAESVLPTDWVILKVDIEGAEYDVIPCLAQYAHATLIDQLYVEEHPWLSAGAAYTTQQYQASIAAIKGAGVQVPYYNSPTL